MKRRSTSWMSRPESRATSTSSKGRNTRRPRGRRRGDGFYYTWLPPLAHRTRRRTGPATPRCASTSSAWIRRRTRWSATRPGDPRDVPRRRAVERRPVARPHDRARLDAHRRRVHGPPRSQSPRGDPSSSGRTRATTSTSIGAGSSSAPDEGAPKYRVFKVDPAHPERAAWLEIVPERSDATLEGSGIVGHTLSLVYLKDVVTQLELRDEDGKLIRHVELPGAGLVRGLCGRKRRRRPRLLSRSRAFTYPTQIEETSVKTGKTSTFYRLKVPVDPSQFSVEQLFATSKDGTRVPFFVIAPKSLVKNGDTPTILYGYGGFQVAQTPSFASSIYPWLERGGIWVVANLRGGSEYGEDWHRHGMRREKLSMRLRRLLRGRRGARAAAGFTKPGRSSPRWAGSNGGLAGRRGRHAAARALSGIRAVRRPPPRHGPLPPLRERQDLDRGVWIGRRRRGLQGALRVFALPPRRQGRRSYPALALARAPAPATTASIRCTPASSRRRCSGRRRGGPVLLRVEQRSGHGGSDLVRNAVEKIADEYAFALDRMKD